MNGQSRYNKTNRRDISLEIGEKHFLTNSEGDENPKAHEQKVRHFKKPFRTMS